MISIVIFSKRIAVVIASFMALSFGLELEIPAEEAHMKQTQAIVKATSPHMVGDGFRVINYFPSNISFSQLSPFVLLDYNEPFEFTPSPKHKRGVGAHPHRGFETVTIVYEGAVAHRDSFGGGGTIRGGDVQWMTAGSGLLHEEFHAKEFADSGGKFHMVQLWVNLPAKDKFTEPKYQSILSKEIGVYILSPSGSNVRVIAGAFKDIKGPASTFTPIEVYDVQLKAGDAVDLKLPESYNTLFLVTGGAIDINDTTPAEFKDLVVFGHNGEAIKLKAKMDSRILVLSGEPINEPVVHVGPFVMNTEEEIKQAYNDFNSGKYGNL